MFEFIENLPIELLLDSQGNFSIHSLDAPSLEEYCALDVSRLTFCVCLYFLLFSFLIILLPAGKISIGNSLCQDFYRFNSIIIPGNDDAIKSIKILTETVADAYLAGRQKYDKKTEKEKIEADAKSQTTNV